MKKAGYVLIGMGLFLFGLVDFKIPLVFWFSGVVAIIFADEYNF